MLSWVGVSGGVGDALACGGLLHRVASGSVAASTVASRWHVRGRCASVPREQWSLLLWKLRCSRILPVESLLDLSQVSLLLQAVGFLLGGSIASDFLLLGQSSLSHLLFSPLPLSICLALLFVLSPPLSLSRLFLQTVHLVAFYLAQHEDAVAVFAVASPAAARLDMRSEVLDNKIEAAIVALLLAHGTDRHVGGELVFFEFCLALGTLGFGVELIEVFLLEVHIDHLAAVLALPDVPVAVAFVDRQLGLLDQLLAA